MELTDSAPRRRLQRLCRHLQHGAAAAFATPQRRITIHYGDGPGRGEVTRMLLAYGGVAYEDIRYAGADFAAITKTAPESDDPTNGCKFPFNQLPALEIDGTFIAQTSTLARYAARLVGLYPAGLEEAAKSDEIFEHSADIQQSTTPIFVSALMKDSSREHLSSSHKPSRTRLRRWTACLGARGRSSGRDRSAWKASFPGARRGCP